MRLYAVRLKANKEAVGFYFASGMRTLWDCVDQVCDPVDCEYTALPDGCGVDFSKKFDGKIATLNTGGNDAAFHTSDYAKNARKLRARLEANEPLLEFLLDPDEASWTRMPATDEPGGLVHWAMNQVRAKVSADG